MTINKLTSIFLQNYDTFRSLGYVFIFSAFDHNEIKNRFDNLGGWVGGWELITLKYAGSGAAVPPKHTKASKGKGKKSMNIERTYVLNYPLLLLTRLFKSYWA